MNTLTVVISVLLIAYAVTLQFVGLACLGPYIVRRTRPSGAKLAPTAMEMLFCILAIFTNAIAAGLIVLNHAQVLDLVERKVIPVALFESMI